MWLTFAPVMAAVGDGKFDLDIPAADADIALKHLSRQTGHSVIFQSVEVEDIQTNSLAGRYTIHVAIEVLLQGTILMGGLTESGVIAVSRKPTGKKEENLQMSIKNPGKSLFAGLVAIITTLTATPHVAGQENAGKSGSLTLEEIVVTAQKRTENLQKVPLAITAIGGEYLRFNDIASFEDLDKLVPGLLFSPYSDAQPEIAIRGIGTKEDGPAANDSTVVSIDDVYIAARIAQVMDIYDLERIEVLRGPQGTLYGRNSIAGSINLVTEKPSDQFKARLEQTYGRFDKLDTRGLITGPISSDNGLYGKISFSRRVHNGYIDSFNENLLKVDEIHERESISARGQLLWTPDDKFEATLTLDGAYNNHNGTNREPVNNSLNTNSIAAVNQARGFADSPYDSLADTYGFLDRKIWGGSLKMSYEFELATLTSITAYRRAYLDWQELCCGVTPAFISNSGMNMVDESTRQLTQELRLNGETDDKNGSWVCFSLTNATIVLKVLIFLHYLSRPLSVSLTTIASLPPPKIVLAPPTCQMPEPIFLPGPFMVNSPGISMSGFPQHLACAIHLKKKILLRQVPVLLAADSLSTPSLVQRQVTTGILSTSARRLVMLLLMIFLVMRVRLPALKAVALPAHPALLPVRSSHSIGRKP